MRIKDENKTIEFYILGYQFPNAKYSKPNNPDYDDNWLTVKVEYTENGKAETYRDSCVLTWELKEIMDAISDVLVSSKSAYISDFMESYLKFAVAKARDKFSFTIDFVCDVSEGKWNKINATQPIDHNQLSAIRDEVKQYLTTYPIK